MPWANNTTIDALRRKYNAAADAHRACVRLLSQARLNGEEPSADLLDDERRTRVALNAARADLLAAMTKVIMGDPDTQPPG